MQRQYVKSGSPFEALYGFSRAVRHADHVHIAGTAPIWPDGTVAAAAGVQAARCFELIISALEEAGGTAADVVRTRMYITDPAIAGEVGEQHREAFGAAAPAATMVVVAGLIDPRWKVEIEADAVV